MQDHEFENKVKQLMRDFQVSPSESVWGQVEENLRKDKRRRRLLIYIPFLFLIGVGGGLLLIKQVPSEKKTTSDSVTLAPAVTEKNDPASSGGHSDYKKMKNNKIDNRNTEKNSSTNASTKPLAVPDKRDNLKLRTPFDQENSSLNSNHENGFRQKKKLRDHIPVISRKDRNVAVTQPTQPAQSVISKQEEIKNKAIVTEEIITSANHNEIENNSITKKEESLLITDSAQERIALYNKSINPLVTPIDSSNNNTNAPVTVQEVKKQKQVHWKWGLTSSVGGTRIAQGSLLSGGIFDGLQKSAVADASADNINYSQVPGAIVFSKSSLINGRNNWRLGIFAERALSSRWRLTIGLQYVKYTTQNAIGNTIDSTRTINNNYSNSLFVNRFYRNGTSTNYTSYYHFLELPVSVTAQINKSKKMPVYWNGGFSLAQLLATNALQFDGNTGIYYKDNSLFRKTQVGIQTGVSVRFFNKSKHPMEIGPQVHYTISNLMKYKFDDSRHILSMGVMAKWYIKK